MPAHVTIPYVLTGGLGLFGAPPTPSVKFLPTEGFLASVAAPGAFTLDAAGGAYALTGTAATPTRARTLTAVAGAYGLTGLAAALGRPLTLVASAGAYALTGAAATLPRTRALVAAAGAYSVTGAPAALSGGRHLTLDASTTQFTVTGVAATLTGALPGPVPLGRQYLLATGGYVNDADTRTRTYLLPGGGYVTVPAPRPSGTFTLVAQAGSYTFIGSTAFLTPTVARKPWLTYHEMMRA